LDFPLYPFTPFSLQMSLSWGIVFFVYSIVVLTGLTGLQCQWSIFNKHLWVKF
jgi:hypothetical protein